MRFPEVVRLDAAIGARDRDTPPLTPHFMIMLLGIVDRFHTTEFGNVQSTFRRQHRIRGDADVVLIGDDAHLRVEKRLLGIEHIKQGALADALLFAHASQGDLRRRHLRIIRYELRTGGDQLRPSGDNSLLRFGTRLLDLLDAGDVGLLGLAHLRIDKAAGVKRHGDARDERFGVGECGRR